MKLSIDRGRCAGHAICSIIAPDVFEIDDEGKAIVLPGADLESQREEILESVAECPALAILLEEV